MFWHSTPCGDTLRSVAAAGNEAYCPCQFFFLGSPLLSVFLSCFLYTTIKFEDSKQEAVRKLSWVQFKSRKVLFRFVLF